MPVVLSLRIVLIGLVLQVEGLAAIVLVLVVVRSVVPVLITLIGWIVLATPRKSYSLHPLGLSH